MRSIFFAKSTMLVGFMGDTKIRKPERRCMGYYEREENVKSTLMKHHNFRRYSERGVGIFDCGGEVRLHERGDISKIRDIWCWTFR